MLKRYQTYGYGVTSPAMGAYPVTPSDAINLPEGVRAITIGQAGTVSFVGDDGKTYTTGNLPIGTYPVFATRIRATGTTAKDITGWA